MRIVRTRAAAFVVALAACVLTGQVTALADWTTYHFDGSHSGYDASAPTVSSFSTNWTQNVDGTVFAEPLYFGGKVYVVTMHDWLYALDSATGAISWSYHIDNPCPTSSTSCVGPGDAVPGDAVGIMSTPVIDPSANVLYAVGMTSLSAYHLWAINLSSHGAIYTLDVSPPPNPASGYNQVTQNSFQNQRGALALNTNGILFIPYGGRDGDAGDYHGYVIAVHASDGSGKAVYHTTFSGSEAGIWAPGGVALDSSGNAYVATGNGSSTTTYDDGEEVLEFQYSATPSPHLVQLTSWAPSNWASLNGSDTDIGSTAPSPVGGGLVFQSGKNGKGYLLRASNMGGIGGDLFSAQVCSSLSFGANAYADPYIYVPCQDGLHALKLDTTTNSFSAVWNHTGITAGPPIVTAGLVWVINTSGGTLYALSPTTGTTVASASIGAVEHFVTPSEGGGNVYVPGSGFVKAFSIGQYSASYDMTSAPTTWVAGQTQTFPVTVTNTGTVTWNHGPSYYEVDLDLHFATSAGGSNNIANWLTSQAFSLPNDVAPSASVTVNVSVTAPSSTGSLVLEAEMIKEHQFWFQQWQAVNVTVAGPTWSASYDMSKAPTTWVAGQTQSFQVMATNTGNVTWPSTGYYEVDLDLHFATSAGGSANQSHWLTSKAFSLPNDVAPGGNVTVNVTVTAPTSSGSLVLEAEMIKEHQFWFQQWQAVNVTVAAPVWSASYDMSTAPASWVAGVSQTFPVTVTNTGNQAWPSTGYYEVDLDLHFATTAGGSANQVNWLTSQAFSLPGDVAPSASATVNVTVTPPSNTGSLVLEAEMIKEHQFWFQQWQAVNVTVAAPVWSASYNLSGVPTAWTRGQSQAITVTVTNTGNVTWPHGPSYYEVDLDFHFTTKTGGSAQQSSWLTSQAFSLPNDVAPGASVTVTVTVTAPNTAGSMFLEAEMIKEHQFWFTQVGSVAVTVS